MAVKEFVALVDDQDNVIGKKDRSLLTDDDRWRVSIIWITNSKNQVLIAKRSMHKPTDPGAWSTAAGGTVQYGGVYDDTAERELKEELGVSLELIPGKIALYKMSLGKRAGKYYHAVADLPTSAFTLQKEEVDDIKWVEKDWLWRDMTKNPQNYVVEEISKAKEIFEK